jgi:hypothetical protein
LGVGEEAMGEGECEVVDGGAFTFSPFFGCMREKAALTVRRNRSSLGLKSISIDKNIVRYCFPFSPFGVLEMTLTSCHRAGTALQSESQRQAEKTLKEILRV